MIERYPTPRVLLLAHRFPYPPDKGDRIRTINLIQWIARRADVHLVCLADEPYKPEALKKLQAICKRVQVIPRYRNLSYVCMAASLGIGRSASAGAFYSRLVKKTVSTWSREAKFDSVVATSSAMAYYLRSPELEASRRVIDLVDVDSQKWLDYAEHNRGLLRSLYQLEGMRLRRLECQLIDWVKHVILVSDSETRLYRNLSGCHHATTVTNGVDLDQFQSQVQVPPVESSCVFIGALDYYPNIQAALWFCREVWPEIRRQRSGATIALVGRHPTREIARLSSIPGVQVVGEVEDVRPYLTGAAIVVVPLKVARGVQNKVLEAMAMGKAIVASPQSLNGLDAHSQPPIWKAVSASDWSDAVLQLLADPLARNRLGIQGRAYVESHHRWDRCLEPLGPILNLPSSTRCSGDKQSSE